MKKQKIVLNLIRLCQAMLWYYFFAMIILAPKNCQINLLLKVFKSVSGLHVFKNMQKLVKISYFNCEVAGRGAGFTINTHFFLAHSLFCRNLFKLILQLDPSGKLFLKSSTLFMLWQPIMSLTKTHRKKFIPFFKLLNSLISYSLELWKACDTYVTKFHNSDKIF